MWYFKKCLVFVLEIFIKVGEIATIFLQVELFQESSCFWRDHVIGIAKQNARKVETLFGLISDHALLVVLNIDQNESKGQIQASAREQDKKENPKYLPN